MLELGGSDAYVILEDADLAQAVEACASGRLINGGQSCVAAKRFIVPDRIRAGGLSVRLPFFGCFAAQRRQPTIQPISTVKRGPPSAMLTAMFSGT